MVQSILMGATIDYAILFTNYYREKRLDMNIPDTLREAYGGSINTILTSGSIIVLCTVILGYAFPNPTIGQICHTIAKGASCALILIIFVLPGALAALDPLLIKKKLPR
jgi:predicted RND superfamily exporter protein